MDVYGLTFIGKHKGPICAVVLQHKLAMGVFDASMISRDQCFIYYQFVAGITSHQDRTAFLIESDLLLSMAKAEKIG